MKGNKITGILLAAVLLLGTSACRNAGEQSEVIQKDIDGIRFETTVMPLDAYKKSRDPGWEHGKAGKDHLYVKLRLRHQHENVDLIKWGCEDQDCYDRRLQFFNNELREHVYLTDEAGGLHVAPLETVYENGYGISPQVDVVMVFKMPEGSSGLRLVFEDRIYTQQIVKFKLSY